MCLQEPVKVNELTDVTAYKVVAMRPVWVDDLQADREAIFGLFSGALYWPEPGRWQCAERFHTEFGFHAYKALADARRIKKVADSWGYGASDTVVIEVLLGDVFQVGLDNSFGWYDVDYNQPTCLVGRAMQFIRVVPLEETP